MVAEAEPLQAARLWSSKRTLARTVEGGGTISAGESLPGIGATPERPRVVSVSRRTDVPAFYSRWFMNRVRAGFCEWVNPFGGRLQRVSLRPQDVAAFVFWTRNPSALFPYLRDLERRGFSFYFHFTINAYPPALEPSNPPPRLSIERFRALSDRVGPERVFWRFDPILVGEAGGVEMDFEYHCRRFEKLAKALSGYTRRCYVSFVSLYRKTRYNLEKVSSRLGKGSAGPAGLPVEERRRLAGELAAIGAGFGMTLYSCCDDALVGAGTAPAQGGVQKARCVDPDVIRRLRPDVPFVLRPRPTRDQ
ncbi:MAG: DUF1848 domain-containing protein, partial [Bacillota bacterium]